jgi:hypothetical protein
MEFQHVNAKLFVEGSEAALEPLVPVFHRWIKEKPFEELLLDVADYRHVYHGPGVIVIGFEADYSLDNTDGQLGILYNRKAALGGTNQDRLRYAVRAALAACQKLEDDEKFKGQIHFRGKEIQIFVNDRFIAPNTEATRAAFEPELKAFCASAFGGADYSVRYEDDPRKRFGVTLATSKPIPADQLLVNLTA